MHRSDQPGLPGPLSKLVPPPPLAFDLLAEIAAGPTARVELCRVREPAALQGQLLAVKRLHPHIAEDPQFASMFVDEVWMTAALVNPNVVRVAGWGTDAEGTYLAVELVQGVSLARLMKTVFETGEAFTERMVVYLGSEICSGLAGAHELRGPEGEPLGLVHRDLTPGNILLGFDGQVKIADFGLAKAKQRVTKTLTGLLKGHPQYMAPEQGREGQIDRRADLFSLGVLLFELFSGKHPWNAGNELEIFRVMASDPPVDLLTLRPKIDRELAAVVSRLLERDPARRFQNADEVRARLLAWLDSHGYKADNAGSVARFVRRNAMRQMRWFERAIGGELKAEAERAKARISISKGRSQPPVPDTGTVNRPAAVSSRRRRRMEEPTEVSSAAEKRLAATTPDGVHVAIDDSPSGEWSEEVPTVVKPTAPLLIGAPSSTRPPSVTSVTPVDEDSDQRTTAVKAKSPAASIVRKLPPPRVLGVPSRVDPSVPANVDPVPMRPATSRGLGPGMNPESPPSQDTLLDMPRVGGGMVDPESEELPTTPVRNPPVLGPGGIGDPSLGYGEADGDVGREADRLASEAARLRGAADRAAKLAAHRAVLAQLAGEAAQLALEAARQQSVPGGQSATLMREARRLEASFRRGEAQMPPDDAEMQNGRVSTAPPIPDAVGAHTPFPSVPPPPPNFGLPPNRPSAPPPDPFAQQSGQLAPSMPMVRQLDSGRPPPMNVGGPRSFQDEIRLLLSGDVFGVPVPIALGVAFAVALALVVLAALVVG
ncbi:MAG: protein kinase [Polyangiaceae bacterium]|nr:protein kinase [Polyangiaceae bacterium]